MRQWRISYSSNENNPVADFYIPALECAIQYDALRAPFRVRKRILESKALLDLWLAMDEIKAKVSYVQPELPLVYGQTSLDFGSIGNEDEPTEN